MVRATPETLTLARRRAQPRAAYITRLALTAVVEGPARPPLRWPASAATPAGHADQDQVESDLDHSLGRAQLIQDELAGLLRAEPGPGRPDPPGGPAGQPAWPTPD